MKKLLVLVLVLAMAAAACTAFADELLQSVSVAPGGCSITVNVFVDKNKNGAKGKSEPLFAGVQLELYSVQDGAEQLVSKKTSSDAETVVFDDLPAGTYRIKASLPANWGFSKHAKKLSATNNMMTASNDQVQISPDLTVEEEEPELACAVGVTQLSGYAGTVWLDVDGDGVRDSEDPGVAGLTVTMSGTKNGLTYKATTQDDGSFSFAQLKPGGYNVSMILPDGYIFTHDGTVFTNDGEDTGKQFVDLNGGVVMEDQQIGITRASEIVVTCFTDSDYNGMHDEGEAPVSGMRVELLREGSKSVIKSSATDADGKVVFNGLLCGTYRVRVVLPGKGYDFTRVAEGGNLFQDDGDSNAVASGLVLAPDETLLIEAGVVKTGSVSGFIFYDDDYSGTYTKKREKVAAYIRVNLVDRDGKVVATVKCDDSGSFTISDIYPGWYRLSVEPKSGYAFTTYGESSIASYHDNAGYSDLFFLSLSEKKTGMMVPMMKPASVNGSVWCDWNDNGVLDQKESGLWNATVMLIRDDGVTAEQTPSSSGRYAFNSVAPGRYRIEVQLPDHAHFVNTIDRTAFTVSDDGNTASTSWFNVTAGGRYSAPSVGGVSLTPVSGYVFFDINADGMADELDEPMAGLTLSVADVEGTTLQSVTSGADGRYELEPLCTGTYIITIAVPDGYMLSRMPADSAMPFAPSVMNESKQVTIGIGDDWSGQNLGLVQPCTVSGSVWIDENGNGRPDTNEGGPDKRAFTLIDMESGKAYITLITDDEGVFRADDLLPGTYLVIYECDGFETIITGEDTNFVPYGDNAWCYGPIVLDRGNKVEGLSLGMSSTTSIAGVARIDDNGTYVPMAGASVRLMNGSGAVLASTLTDDNGCYRFDGLASGDYCIDAYAPEGWIMADADDWRSSESDTFSVMRYTAGNYGRSDVFTLRMGRHQLEKNFGAVAVGSLGDRCWLDLNGNGLQETEEGGIPNVKIQLLDQGTVVAETVTDQYGYYRFDRLYPGEYVLHVIYPPEVTPTASRTDFHGATSVMQEDSIDSYNVRVTSNGHNYSADLGFVLVQSGVYPAGYGTGETQTWKKK